MSEADSISRPRTRAKRACLHCNRRRIRCNVLETRPCQNCVSMNVPCEVGISKRGKYPRNKTAHRPVTPSLSGGVGSLLTAASLVDSSPSTIHSDFHGIGGQYTPGTPASHTSNVLHHSPQPYQSQTYRSPTGPSRSEPGGTAQQTVFLGESSPLTVVIDEGRRSPDKGYASVMQSTRLHYAIPERIDAASARDDALRAHNLKLESQLNADGAFSFPPKNTCETLLEAYFTWFHPCFPILDRAAVHRSYVRGELPPLLLQAMLFIGVSLCTDAALARTEFEVRYRAKFLFYSRARSIYDADWEKNKIIKLQSLFLLSFWRGGPSEERDTRFWLGAAIGLAQKKGMHMMSKLSFPSTEEEKLWRRIWWALYVTTISSLASVRLLTEKIRDQQSSAALGLPPRIRDEDCDVAMLEQSDILEDERLKDAQVFGTQSVEHISYPVEMAKLARILREIVSTQYLPMKSTTDSSSRALLHQQLRDWESNLPVELRLGNSSKPSAIFLVGLLHMTYNNLYILLYRSSFLHPRNGSTDIDDGHIALEAATKSTRIIEDMLSHNLVQHGPTHLITHAFSTLCIQTIHCRRTTGTIRKLSEHRARLCLLGLQELQKTWDLENWVLDLFFRCLDDSMARRLRLTDSSTINTTQKHKTRASEPFDEQAQSQDANTPNTATTQRDNNPQDPVLESSQASPTTMSGDITAPDGWYGLFNFTEDYTDVLGEWPSQADSLNLQNLEFLYRFL